MPEENVEIMRSMLRPFEGTNLAAIDLSTEWFREVVGQAYAHDVELRTLESGAGAGLDPLYRGWDGVVRYMRDWLEPFSEYHVEALDYVEAGDHVLVPSRQWGLGSGSGARVELEITLAYELRDGKIARMAQYETLEQAREAVRAGE